MSCTNDRELLSAYADGELSAAERAEVETHVAACGECRRAIEEYRRMAGILRGMPRERAPANLWRDVQARLPARVTRFPRWVAPSLAAAATLVIGLSIAHFAKSGGPAELRGPSPSAPLAIEDKAGADTRRGIDALEENDGANLGVVAGARGREAERPAASYALSNTLQPAPLAGGAGASTQVLCFVARPRGDAGDLDLVLRNVQGSYAAGGEEQARFRAAFAGRLRTSATAYNFDAASNTANWVVQSKADADELVNALAQECELTPVAYGWAQEQMAQNRLNSQEPLARRMLRDETRAAHVQELLEGEREQAEDRRTEEQALEPGPAEQADAPGRGVEPPAAPPAAEASTAAATPAQSMLEEAHSHGGEIEAPIEVWVLFETPEPPPPAEERERDR